MTEDNKLRLEYIFAKRLIKKALIHPTKDTVNAFYKNKYAEYDAVQSAVDNAIASIKDCPIDYDFRVAANSLVLVVVHKNGFLEESDFDLPKDGKPQEKGAAITFGRRYLLSAAFDVVADKDDDGNAASGIVNKPVIKHPTAEQNAQFKVFKDRLKASQDLEELSAYFKGAWPNIRMLPEDLVAELTKIKDDKKKELGA